MAAVTLGLLGGRDGKYAMTAMSSRTQTPVSVYETIHVLYGLSAGGIT